MTIDLTIEEGKPAPDFTLPDGEGNDVSLSDFRGKHVIVYFYPKDETPGCTQEACAFRDLWDQIQARNAVVLGVSPDDGESHRKFAANHDLPFPLVSDPDKKVMEPWGAWGEKNMYGKKITGVIRSTVWVAPDGTVKKHWKRVGRAADHPAKVLELLEGEG